MDGLTRKDFLDALYGDYFKEHSGFLVIKGSTDWYAKNEPVFYSDPQLLARQRFEVDKDVYFGICPLERMMARRDQIGYITALWANLDVGKEAHRPPEHYSAYEEAAKAITQFPLPPSVVVDSGRGFHLYWLLTTVLEVPSLRLITGLLGDISRFFRGYPQTNPDATMRLPQTFNNKVKGKSLPCLVKNLDTSRRYDIEDFNGLEKLAVSRGLGPERLHVPSEVPVDRGDVSDFDVGSSDGGLDGQPDGSEGLGSAPGREDGEREGEKFDTQEEVTVEVVRQPEVTTEFYVPPGFDDQGTLEIEITDDFVDPQHELSESGLIEKQEIALEHSLGETTTGEGGFTAGRAGSTAREKDLQDQGLSPTRTYPIDPDDLEVRRILEVEAPSVVLTREDLALDDDELSGEDQITAEPDLQSREEETLTDSEAITTRGIDFEAVEAILAGSSQSGSTNLLSETPDKIDTMAFLTDRPLIDFGDDDVNGEASLSSGQADSAARGPGSAVSREVLPDNAALIPDAVVDAALIPGEQPGGPTAEPPVAQRQAGTAAPQCEDEVADVPIQPSPIAPFTVTEGFGNLDDEDEPFWTLEEDLDLSIGHFQLVDVPGPPTSEADALHGSSDGLEAHPFRQPGTGPSPGAGVLPADLQTGSPLHQATGDRPSEEGPSGELEQAPPLEQASSQPIDGPEASPAVSTTHVFWSAVMDAATPVHTAPIAEEIVPHTPDSVPHDAFKSPMEASAQVVGGPAPDHESIGITGGTGSVPAGAHLWPEESPTEPSPGRPSLPGTPQVPPGESAREPDMTTAVPSWPDGNQAVEDFGGAIGTGTWEQAQLSTVWLGDEASGGLEAPPEEAEPQTGGQDDRSAGWKTRPTRLPSGSAGSPGSERHGLTRSEGIPDHARVPSTPSMPDVIPSVSEILQEVPDGTAGSPGSEETRAETRGKAVIRGIMAFVSRIGSLFSRKSTTSPATVQKRADLALTPGGPRIGRVMDDFDPQTQTPAPISLLCGASLARIFETGTELPATRTALIRPGRAFSGEPMEVYEGARRLVLIPLSEALRERGADVQVELTIHHSGPSLIVDVKDPDSDWQRAYRLSLPQWDLVECHVHSPQAVAPGRTFGLQVGLQKHGQAGGPRGPAESGDRSTETLASEALTLRVSRGSALDVQLVIEGLSVQQPHKKVVWDGGATTLSYAVSVPRGFTSGIVSGRVIVSSEDVPLGRVSFTVSVGPAAESPLPNVRLAGEPARFGRFYPAFAWEDRAEVVQRVQGMKLTGVTFPPEVLRWGPEDKLDAPWRRHVDECDAVLLFWSSNSSLSARLTEEHRYALETKGSAGIIPVALGGDAPVELPLDLVTLGPAALAAAWAEPVGRASRPAAGTGLKVRPTPRPLERPDASETRAAPDIAERPDDRVAPMPVSIRFGNIVKTLVREGSPVPGGVSVRLKVPKSGSDALGLDLSEGGCLVESFPLAELRETLGASEVLVLSMQHLGRVLFVQFKPDGPGKGKNYHLPLDSWDTVEIGVSSQPLVQAGSQFRVNVTAGPAAAGSDFSVKRLATPGLLPFGVMKGSVLVLKLVMRGLDVRDPFKAVTWEGRAASASFAVTVPSNHVGDRVRGVLTVSRNGVPLGQVGFKVQVVRPGEAPGQAPQLVTQARPFESFYVCSASEDRAEVSRRLQQLQLTGKRFRANLLTMTPAQRWSKKAYRSLDDVDAVLLFWSRHAANSEWVKKECLYAIKKKGIDAIIAVPLERPVPALPSELAALSFHHKVLGPATTNR